MCASSNESTISSITGDVCLFLSMAFIHQVNNGFYNSQPILPRHPAICMRHELSLRLVIRYLFTKVPQRQVYVGFISKLVYDFSVFSLYR